MTSKHQGAPGDLPAPAPSNVSPEAVRRFRAQLTIGDDVVDPTTWAGSVPEARGVAPRVRVSRDKWFNLLWMLPISLGFLIVAVAAAQGLRATPSVQRFIVRYPGTVKPSASSSTIGLPPGWGFSTSSTSS